MFVEHKEALEVTVAPAKTLKLSEAIRRGCKHTRQCAGHYIDGDAACVYGAAAIGMGGNEDLACILHTRSQMEHNAFTQMYGLGIMHANDSGGWTREAIADALEALGY